MPSISALSVYDRNVGRDCGARPALVIASSSDRGDAAFAADGSDHGNRLRARDGGLSVAEAVSKDSGMGYSDGDWPLRADRICLTAHRYNQRDRLAHAAQSVRSASRALLRARWCLCDDQRQRRHHCWRGDCDGPDAAARSRWVRPCDV